VLAQIRNQRSASHLIERICGVFSRLPTLLFLAIALQWLVVGACQPRKATRSYRPPSTNHYTSSLSDFGWPGSKSASTP
jgi:hypothetical protein